MTIREGKAKSILIWHGVYDIYLLDNVEVKLYDSGIVEAKNSDQDFVCHISNCQILWDYKEEEEESPQNKIKLLRPTKTTNEQ